VVNYAVGGGVFDADGNPTTGLKVKVCTSNSTSTQLGGGEVFTGTAGDLLGYASLLITVYSDVASATDGLSIQFSHQAAPYDWHAADVYTIAAGAYKTFTLQPVDRYFRITYTNGASATASFHLSVMLHSVAPKPSSHRMADDISGQDDATLTKAILAAERPGTAGVYTNVQATNGGNLKVSLEEIDGTLTSDDGDLIVASLPGALEIAEGVIPGHKSVNKFGFTPNADSGIPTDVWDAAAQPIWLAPTAARVHAIVSTSDVDGKTGAPTAAGARTVQVYGLVDWDTAESSEIVTLDGTTPVNTGSAYVIIHRMKVLTSGASGPNVGIISATAAADATVTAYIQAGVGQTLMAIYGIPSTQKAYMTQFYVTLERDSPTGAAAEGRLLYTMDVATSPTIFITKHTFSLDNDDPEVLHPFNPYNGFTGPGIFKLQITSDAADTESNAGFDLILVDN